MAVAAAMSPVRWVEDRQYRWLLAALLVMCVVYSLVPGELLVNPNGPISNQQQTQIPWLTRVQWLPILAAAGWVMLRRWPVFTRFAQVLNPLIAVYLGWMLLSAFWSPDAGFVFRQWLIMLAVSAAAVAFCLASWTPQRMMTLLRNTITFMLVLSLLVALFKPSIGVHSENQFELLGSWRGITYQKNGLGQLAAVAIIVWFHAALTGAVSRGICVAALALAVLLILKSRSSTSLVVSMLACTVQFVVIRPPLRLPGGTVPLWSLLGLLVLAPLFFDLALTGSFGGEALAEAFGSIFGKDATFSGRTLIWAETLRNIAARPWLGYGFNSYWLEKGGPAEISRQILGWNVPNAHNGYLEIVNELGLVGLAIFLLMLVLYARQLRLLARVSAAQFALHLSLLVYLLIANLTEVGWFHPIAFTHVVMMFSMATVARLELEARLRQSLLLSPAIPPTRQAQTMTGAPRRLPTP